MSEPKRYHHFIKAYSKSFTDIGGAKYCYPDAGMIEDKDGKYVEYADYARLKAEVEWLKEFYDLSITPNRELQAQVERLTKAGDAMLAEWKNTQAGHYSLDEAESAWHAAKGVQS